MTREIPPALSSQRARMCFFSYDPATSQIYTLSLHDALPIFEVGPAAQRGGGAEIRAEQCGQSDAGHADVGHDRSDRGPDGEAGNDPEESADGPPEEALDRHADGAGLQPDRDTPEKRAGDGPGSDRHLEGGCQLDACPGRERDDHRAREEDGAELHDRSTSSASCTVATPCASRGGRGVSSRLLLGTTAWVKPSCAASRRRASSPVTARTSPVKPTSPRTTTSPRTGRSM